MNLCLFYNASSGRINSILTLWNYNYISGNVYEGSTCLIVNTSIPSETLLSSYIVSNRNLLQIGIAPSEYHSWSLLTNSWEISTEKLLSLKNKLKNDIDSRRIELSFLPITYDLTLFDADLTTITINLPGKLQEIVARESINIPMSAELCFWKDSENTIHTFPNQTEYKNWLQGLVIAISSRNTALYAAAWTKKAELEALTDINDILNYDVSVGWTV